MKKLIIYLLVVSSAIAQNNKSAVKKIDRSSAVKLENQVKLPQEIVIDEPESFTWNDPVLLKELGYESISFPKQKIIIYKDKMNEYGKATLIVEKAEKNDKTAVSDSKSFIGGCQLRGGINCDRFGFRCLVIIINRGENKVNITPVIKENKLVALDIKFLNEGDINGKKWDGNPKDSDKMNAVKKAYYQAVMLQLVTESKLFYKQGQNVTEFASATGVDYNSLTQNGKLLLNDIFKYVSKNVSDKELLQSYDGISLDNLASNPNDVPNGKKIKNFWKKLKLTLDKIGELICIWSDEC